MHAAHVLPNSPAEEPSWGQKISCPAQAALLPSANTSSNTNIMKCLATLYPFVLGEEGIVADGSQVGRRAPRRQ